MSAERKTLEERAQMSDIDRLRHSCAHVMATAILRLWPNAQFAYGPPVENGFYYDFDLPDHRITPDDFEKIEAEMKKIAKENQKFEWKGVSRDEAIALAKSGRLGGLSGLFGRLGARVIERARWLHARRRRRRLLGLRRLGNNRFGVGLLGPRVP